MEVSTGLRGRKGTPARWWPRLPGSRGKLRSARLLSLGIVVVVSGVASGITPAQAHQPPIATTVTAESSVVAFDQMFDPPSVGSVIGNRVSDRFPAPLAGSIDPLGCVSATGTGGECAVGTALDGATGVSLSPDGTSVYVASETSRSVSVFS